MSVARIIVFIVVMLVVLGGINAQVSRWARKAFALGPRARRALQLALGFALLGMLLGRVVGRFWPGAVTTFVITIASVAELAVVISAVVLLFADAAGLLLGLPARLGRRLAKARPEPSPGTPTPQALSPAPQVAPTELPRRQLLTQAVAGSAFLIGGTSALYGALKGRYDYSLE